MQELLSASEMTWVRLRGTIVASHLVGKSSIERCGCGERVRGVERVERSARACGCAGVWVCGRAGMLESGYKDSL